MATLIKFKKTTVESVFEKEIDLPAYFTYGEATPSDFQSGKINYCNIVAIIDPDKRSVNIKLSRNNALMEEAFNNHDYGRSCWENGYILDRNEFKQVPKCEWEIAKGLLMGEISGL